MPLSKAYQGTEGGKETFKIQPYYFARIFSFSSFLSFFKVISLWDKMNNPHLIGISPF